MEPVRERETNKQTIMYEKSLIRSTTGLSESKRAEGCGIIYSKCWKKKTINQEFYIQQNDHSKKGNYRVENIWFINIWYIYIYTMYCMSLTGEWRRQGKYSVNEERLKVIIQLMEKNI